jgi:hypothetical protein
LKKNRSTLKDYFKKGAIPTEANFADLIDSMLTQDEDNISKLPNDPLKITATGVDEALLNFYRVENTVEKIAWQIKQKPDGKAGLNISDTAGSRLFIESGTGNVGIGTTTPKSKVHLIADGGSELRISGGNDGTASRLLITETETTQPGTWGAMFEYDGSADDLNIGHWRSGKPQKDLIVKVDGSVGIGTTNTNKNRLRVEGGSISTTSNLHTQRGRLAFSNTSDDANHTIYNNVNNIDAEGAWDGMKMNVFNGLDIRVGDAGAKKQISALRIESTGNIGIGLVPTTNALHVATAKSVRFELGTSQKLSLGGNGSLEVDAPGIVGGRFIVTDAGSVGIGINPPKAKLHVSGGQVMLDGAQKIVFSDDDTSNNLKVQLWTGYGLGINGSTLFYAANGNHSWRDASGTNERMLLTTGADGGLTVKGTGVSSFAGTVTVGSLQLKGFTGADADEWPNVFWYRDTANNWDEGLIKNSAARGKFGHAGFGIHMHQSRQFGLFSTGWDSLLAVEGGTGNTFIKGYLGTKQIYFSAYVESNSRTGNLTPLPMQATSQNVGNAFNTSTSKFTAPIKGVYLFTMSALRADDTADWLHWYLRVNDNYANPGGTTADEGAERGLLSMKGSTCSSARTVILVLNANDTVWIQQIGSAAARVDNFRSGLEGVLISAIY